MDIRHKGDVATCLAHTAAYLSKVLRLADALRRQADQFATCLGNSQYLPHATVGVHRRSGTHRLNPHGVVTANTDVANPYLVGFPSLHQFTLKLYFTSASSALAFTIFSFNPCL